MELVALKGSEKQIAWAERIRTSAVAEAQAVLDNPVWERGFETYRPIAERAFRWLCKQNESSWWIDNRGKNGAILLTAFARMVRDNMKAAGEGATFRNPNQFMTGDRAPLIINGAYIY